MDQRFNVRMSLPVRALNAGLFVSRGKGRHPTRTIRSYQLILVNTGQLNIWEGEKSYTLGPGETLILFPGSAHGGIDDYHSDTSFYWIHFATGRPPKGDRLARIPVPKSAHLGSPERLIELFRLFLNDQESGSVTPIRGCLLVLQMLNELSESGGQKGPLLRQENVIANRAEQYIRIHFHESIGTSLIARSLNCNANYLSRTFRRAFHESVIDHIHNRRIHYARNLLLNTTRSTKEIGFECGFENPSYFIKIFKRYQGMTPAAYRLLFARMHVNAEQ